MTVAVLGPDTPLRHEVLAECQCRGIRVSDEGADVVICLTAEDAARAAATPGLRRLVQRSTAYVYGSSDKNPGYLTEDRVSLLPPNAPEQKWLRAEETALRFSNTAVLRLANVLHPAEGDLAVRQLSRAIAVQMAGRDPNLQFLSLRDAARALVTAAQSPATGLFNVGGAGSVPFKRALRAAGCERIPLPGSVKRQALEFNWTVSGERAGRELGFRPEQSSVEALREFIAAKSGARPEFLDQPLDPWGLDVEYIRAWGWWFWFLRKVYWRVDHEGLENIPEAGRAMFVSNHRGFMPLDAVVHLSLIFTHRRRICRFLIIPSLLRMPYLSNFLTKLGGVIANQENAKKLFDAEELVGVFPEGIRGTFSPYRQTYQLRDFAKSAFAKIAIENRSPIIPTAVIGHSEIFPIIGRIDSGYITRTLGWPYFPIAPLFPLAPIPIPSKWHVRVLKPVPVDSFKPEDAENVKLVRDFSRHIQDIVQQNLNDMVPKRKSYFWGRVLDGTAPAIAPFVR